MVHGVMLLVSVLFLSRLMNSIPLATLAAILLLTGYKLAKPAVFVEMFRRGRYQFIPFMITIAAILIDDLLKGIAIGTVIGLIFVIRTNFHSAITMKQKDNNYLIRFRKDVTLSKMALSARDGVIFTTMRMRRSAATMPAMICGRCPTA